MKRANGIQLRVEQSLFGSSQDEFLHNEDNVSLSELIPQILAERKSFLNISEQSLQEEIDRKNDRMSIDEEDDEDNLSGQERTDVDEEGNHQQQMEKMKGDFLANVNSAINETSLSLDFVSLLMSAVRPNITKATISPHLSKSAPLGSLNSDRLYNAANSGSSKAVGDSSVRVEADKIGMGWKYQTLGIVKSLFKDAASQLEAQAEIDKVYWNQVEKMLSHGAVLFKTRDPLTNARAVGVQYGYGDSGSTYFDKGHAVLRKNEQTGEVSFVPISSGQNKVGRKPNKFTRVRILSKIDDDYMLTGQSVFEKEALEKYPGEELLSEYEKARYFLFEEDLFYHMTREAKFLLSYNVSIISDKIIIDVLDQIIELEAVVYDENNEEELENLYQNTNVESSKNNGKAQDILKFLKIMLCCYFNYRLELKSRMPTAHAKWKQNNSHPLLLRPLIGHTRHHMNVHNISSILKKLCREFEVDKVLYEMHEQRYKNLTVSKISTNPFQKAVEKPLSTFTVVLQNANEKKFLKADVEVTSSDIFVDLIINLAVSAYETKDDMDLNVNGTSVLNLSFTDIVEFEESITWTFANNMRH